MTDEMTIWMGLDPSHYKILDYKFTKGVGGAFLRLLEFPEYDDLVTAPVSHYFNFEIKCLDGGEPPEILPVTLMGQSITIRRGRWHDDIGFYSASRVAFEQVPYGVTLQ